MRKKKGLFALLLTLAMVLGMSMTTFGAVDPVDIVVTGVNADSTVSYEQIIEPNQKTLTGWAFTNTSSAASFQEEIKKGEGNSQKSDQMIIAGLIISVNPENGKKLPATLQKDAASISSELLARAFQEAVSAAASSESKKTAEVDGADYKIEATTAGVYVIHAKDVKIMSNGKVTSWIKYNPMASYVSFAYTNGAVTSLDTPDAVAAKSEEFEISLSKADNETDKVTAVGDVVTYTISTVVPYIPDDVKDENVYFNIVDMINGAQYVSDETVEDGPAPNGMEEKVATEVGDTVPVSITLGEDSVDGPKTAGIINCADSGYTYSFSLDLKEIAKNRANAGKTLEIQYKAYVTSTVIDNYAETKLKTQNDQTDPEDGPGAVDKIYTGTLQMTKYDGDAGENTTETLANAKFVLYYKKDDTTYYAVTEKNTDDTIKVNNVKVDYIVTGWTTKKPEAEDALLVTQENGTFTVKGLEDDKDREYKFEEVEAPEGYSLNNSPADITWGADRNQADSAADRLGVSQISDTKLSTLPSTGGIGTTIFTIAGCLIMIAAAGLFFLSRRKSEKK